MKCFFHLMKTIKIGQTSNSKIKDCKIRCISQIIWWIKRLIEWFLHTDSDWIIFYLTTNLLCIFDICWVSTAVLFVKNEWCFASSGHRKSFPNAFNESLIKCGKIFPCAHSAKLLSATISKFCYSSYMVITLRN